MTSHSAAEPERGDDTADVPEHQPTVLLVEDNEPVRLAMAAILAREGFLVLTAATGHDAIAIIHEPLSALDVVVLDVHLPDASGVDLCARLRERYPKMPIIVCTGEATPEEATRLL